MIFTHQIEGRGKVEIHFYADQSPVFSHRVKGFIGEAEVYNMLCALEDLYLTCEQAREHVTIILS